MNLRRHIRIGLTGMVFLLSRWLVFAWEETPVDEDPLVFMPGSQPGSLLREIEPSSNCLSCHAGYQPSVEPGHNWQGSMMAQAGRDPLWLACTVVAIQDSIWALGTPNAADLCIRCHSPGGWLGGRSDPPNMTRLSRANGVDYDGVNCDSCHRMVDPMNALGQPDVPAETTSEGQAAAAVTMERDWTEVLQWINSLDGSPFLDETTRLPKTYGEWPAYREAVSGQFYMEGDVKVKMGPRYDSEPKSKTVAYSRFQKSKNMCATCHDVSNPVLANLAESGASSTYAAGSYFHVERTWSEFQLSAYARQGGAATHPRFQERTGIAFAASCQDCHMRKVTGKACNKNVPERSDLALHDLSGGNTWITRMLATVDVGGAVYDPYNAAILSGAKYPGAVIDVDGLQGVAPALLDGELRARENLRSAASLELVAETKDTLRLRIVNHTGHKLISGFPEGRRMWLYVRFMDEQGATVGEVNPYRPLVTRMENGSEVYESGGDLQVTRDDLVYEAKLSSSLTGESQTFHFVLATGRYKDNRIPPKGFEISGAAARLVEPCWEGVENVDYFSPEEYAGGYDEVEIAVPEEAEAWRAVLYYQTTSKSYVAFLRDEIQAANKTLSEPTLHGGDPTSYLARTDPYFDSIEDWGLAIYDLWLHNGGAPPEYMAQLISRPEIEDAERLADGMHLHFDTLPERIYQLEYTESLIPGNWQPLGEPVDGDGSEHLYIDDISGSVLRFYRVRSQQPEP